MELIEIRSDHINFNNNDYGIRYSCPKCNLELPIYIIFNEAHQIKEMGINGAKIIYNPPIPKLSPLQT